MNRVRKWRIGAAAVAAMGLAAAWIDAGAAEAAQPKIAFNIEAQPIGDALNAFASQSGLQVLYLSKLGRDVTAPRVRGSLTAQEALQQLLGATGLKFEFINPRTITVRTAAGAAEDPATERAAAPRAGAGPQPIKLSLVTPGPAPADEEDSSAAAAAGAGEAGSLSGHVTEAQIGGNLVGALVRIEETGQTAATDDMGYFRFPTVAPGRYTLYVSYLGYPARRATVTMGGGQALSADIKLGAQEDLIGSMEVFGARSARAQALNQQRTAENSSEVVSADMLGDFTGTTISEAMRRMSGIAFSRDFHTGDGVNIIIRGLAPEMNQIKLNGLNLPVGDGTGRAPSLNSLLADSVSKITVHKTLLPSHESAGIGGLVEIETKAPLDRPRNFVNFAAESGRRANDFGEDTMMSGTVSHTFGEAGRFGLSGSAQYRQRQTKSIEYHLSQMVFGQWLPLDANGQPTITSFSAIDPFRAFPFEEGDDQAYVGGYSSSHDELSTDTLAVTLSGQLRFGGHTDLRLDATRSQSTTDRVEHSNNFDGTSAYQLRPVAALGGQMRQALGWNGAISASQSYQVNDGAEMRTDTFSLQGVTELNKWRFNYTLGSTEGANSTPGWISAGFGFSTTPSNPFLASYISPEAVDPVEGRIISVFPQRQDRSFPVPYLTPEGYAYLNDPARYAVQFGSINISEGSNVRRTAAGSGRYDFSLDHLKYLEVGLNYERAKFRNSSDGGSFRPTFITNPCCSQAVVPMSTFGLTFEPVDLSDIGRDGGNFPLVPLDQVRAFVASLPEAAQTPGSLLTYQRYTNNVLSQGEYTLESNLATYLQARLDLGKLEIVGGARVNRIDVQARVFTSPQYTGPNFESDPAFVAQFTRLLNQTARQTEVLPRVSFNYRQTDNLIFRAGYYMSVARPAIRDLSADKQVNLNLRPSPFGAGAGRPTLTVYEGNPDLEPAVTHSFDLSGEYYHDEIGVIRFSAFYKIINNLMETNVVQGSDQLEGVELPDHPYFQNLPANLYVTAQKPVNSDFGASLWGVEAALERRFTFLPGAWSGLGVYSNISYADSSKTEVYNWLGSGGATTRFELPNQAFNSQPKYTGTAALTYSKYGIDGTLAYSRQARWRQYWSPNSIYNYQEGLGTLDLRAAYLWRGKSGSYRAFFEVSNLLAGPEDADQETTMGGYYLSGNFQGGRQLKIGFSGSF